MWILSVVDETRQESYLRVTEKLGKHGSKLGWPQSAWSALSKMSSQVVTVLITIATICLPFDHGKLDDNAIAKMSSLNIALSTAWDAFVVKVRFLNTII